MWIYSVWEAILRLFLITTLAMSALLTVTAAETETIDRSFDFTFDGTVTLKNVNGNVEIHGWDEARVRVVAVKKARGSNAHEKLERNRVSITATTDRIDIATEITRSRGWNNNVSVNYELWVPRTLNLSAKTTNGNVRIETLDGEINLRSTNGNLIASEVGGRINGATTNGGITVDMESYMGGDMEFRTTNGSIKVTAPASMAADISARTTNGSIRTDFPVEINGKVSRRVLQGRINGGGDTVSLKTTNGSIKLNEG